MWEKVHKMILFYKTQKYLTKKQIGYKRGCLKGKDTKGPPSQKEATKYLQI